MMKEQQAVGKKQGVQRDEDKNKSEKATSDK